MDAWLCPSIGYIQTLMSWRIVNFLIHWSGYPPMLQCEDQKLICGWHNVLFFMCTSVLNSPTASQEVPRSHSARVLFLKVTGFSPVRAKKSLEPAVTRNPRVWLLSGVDFIWPVSKTYCEFGTSHIGSHEIQPISNQVGQSRSVPCELWACMESGRNISDGRTTSLSHYELVSNAWLAISRA